MEQNHDELLKWKGLPVLTTKMLAERLGVFEINIRTNFSNNKERYVLNTDYFVLQGSQLKEFRHFASKNKSLTNEVDSKTRSIALWTESGCYNHAKSSNSPEAWDAFIWLKNNYFRQKEALKAIRESLTPQSPLLAHTKREVQLVNSKEINKINFETGGVGLTKEYNIKSCKLHSGYYPKQLKEIAKKKGLKSKQMTSGKEILRNLKPEVAACMSVTDDLCKFGATIDDVAHLSMAALPLFQKMKELGMNINPAKQ